MQSAEEHPHRREQIMSPSTEQVLQTALSLPPGEQIELIESLIAALDQTDPQPLDDASMAEIRRRSAEYDAGKVTPIPWSAVRQRARAEGESNG
jgi:putative addiction module component (TIGR02574 family)